MPFPLSREISSKTLRILSASQQEINVSRQDLLRELDVEEIVRVPSDELPKNLQPNDKVVHFNLVLDPVNIMRSVALVRLVSKGLFIPSGQEISPLLSVRQIYRATLIASWPQLDFHQLPETWPTDWPDRSLGDAKIPEDIRQLLFRRYASVLPTLTADEIIAQGIGIRHFCIEESISLNW